MRADACAFSITARASWMQALLNSTSDSGTSTVRSSIASSSRPRSLLMRRPQVDVDDLGAVAREPLEQVHVGRELELGHHDLAPRGRRSGSTTPMIACATVTFWCIEIEPGVTPRIGARRSPVVAADLPPPLVPGPHAAAGPGLGVLLQVCCSPARHCAERMTDEIGAVLDGRELAAPRRERVTGQQSCLSGCRCPRPRDRGSRRSARR